MRHLFSASIVVLLVIAANARGADEWRANLPPDWLGVVIVHDLPEFDRQADRMAKLFGMEAPQLVRLLEAAGLTDVTDVERSWIVGLARDSEGNGVPYPFAFIPVTDFDAFVNAYDGDINGKTAIVTIEQQDLLAGNCGKWMLLMNPDRRKVVVSIMAREPDELPEDGDDVDTTGIARLKLSGAGLKWLTEYQPAGEQPSREQAIARRKRGLAMLSPEGIRESLTLDKPMWKWVATTFADASVVVDLDKQGAAKLRIVAAKQQAPEKVAPMDYGREVDWLGDRPWVSVGRVHTSPELVSLAAGWQMAQLESAPEELGIEKVSEAELTELERALANVIEQVTNADFAALADDALPIYGNRLAVIEVSNSDDFFEACDELMNRWNALITASNAKVTLTFAVEPVRIAGRAGRRYFVDVVEAVDVPRSREVAKVMADMFGPNGILNWYVLPMEGKRTVVANLPHAAVEKLVGELTGESSKPQAASGSANIAFDASAYVDWGKRRDRAMQGEVIGGRPFVPLPKSEPLQAHLSLRDGALKIELELTESLLETLGEHARELREQ